MDRSAAKSEALLKAQRLTALERFRLTTMTGREPTAQELHDAVREECVSWCESWFSDAEKALSPEARHALALSWLQETGVLAVVDEASQSSDHLLESARAR